MSDDVNARHALLVFRQAYFSSVDVAGQLIAGLVIDLQSDRSTVTKRHHTAITALCALEVSFSKGGWPSPAAWELANEALQAWCAEP
jgi:hypothetical protein